jgi:hypothetical protein
MPVRTVGQGRASTVTVTTGSRAARVASSNSDLPTLGRALEGSSEDRNRYQHFLGTQFGEAYR